MKQTSLSFLRFYALTFLLFAISCKKDSTVVSYPKLNPDEINRSVLDVVWQSRMHVEYDIMETISQGILLNSSDKIALLDELTGAVKWEWEDLLTTVGNQILLRYYQIVGDILIVNGINSVYAINLNTGKTVWKHHFTEGCSYQLFKDDFGYIYKGFLSPNDKFTIYIKRTLPEANDWETVCTYKDKSKTHNYMNIGNIGFGQNSKGERIMVFSIDNQYSPQYLSVLNGFNLKTMTYEWTQNYTNVNNAFHNDKVVSGTNQVVFVTEFGVESKLLAINPSNGLVTWSKPTIEQTTSISSFQGNIILTSDNGSFPDACQAMNLNIETGNSNWTKSYVEDSLEMGYDVSFSHVNVTYYKDYLFSTNCKKLWVIDLRTGNVVFKDYVALPRGCLDGKVTISESNRLIYINDSYNLIAYKIPSAVVF